MQMTETKTRPVSKTLLIVISLVVIAVVGAIVAGIHFSNPYLHKKVVEILQRKIPRRRRTQGVSGLPVSRSTDRRFGPCAPHEGRTDVPPLISIREFSAEAGILGLPWKPWKVDQVTLKGLVIQIPPKGDRGNQNWPKAKNLPVLIGEIISDDAELRMLPKSADKDPHVFAIHHLVMHSVGLDRPGQI